MEAFKRLAKEVVGQALTDLDIDYVELEAQAEYLKIEINKIENKNKKLKKGNHPLQAKLRNILARLNYYNDALRWFDTDSYRYWLGKSEYNGNAIRKFIEDKKRNLTGAEHERLTA